MKDNYIKKEIARQIILMNGETGDTPNFDKLIAEIKAARSGNIYWPFWVVAKYCLVFEAHGEFDLWVPSIDDIDRIADDAIKSMHSYKNSSDVHITPYIRIKPMMFDSEKEHLWNILKGPKSRVEKMFWFYNISTNGF